MATTKVIKPGEHLHVATGETITQVSNVGADSWRPYSWRTSLGDFAFLKDAARALDAKAASGVPA